MDLLTKGKTGQTAVFLMVDASDHITGKTGLTPTVTLSKAGGALASPTGTVSEVGSGLYKLTLDVADVDTFGALVIHATAAGADPCDHAMQVIAPDVEDAASFGLTTLNSILSRVMAISPGSITTSSAVLESGAYVILVKGDDYTSASPRGVLSWTPSQDGDWPDLTGAVGTFTVRLNSTDAVELSTPATILNPAGPNKEVNVSLDSIMTSLLSVSTSLRDHKFDVQLTLANGSIWTPIRGGDNVSRSGGLTVIETQTR